MQVREFLLHPQDPMAFTAYFFYGKVKILRPLRGGGSAEDFVAFKEMCDEHEHEQFARRPT